MRDSGLPSTALVAGECIHQPSLAITWIKDDPLLIWMICLILMNRRGYIVENVKPAMKQNKLVIAEVMIGTKPGSCKTLKAYFCKHNTNLA